MYKQIIHKHEFKIISNPNHFQTVPSKVFASFKFEFDIKITNGKTFYLRFGDETRKFISKGIQKTDFKVSTGLSLPPVA